MKQYFEAEMRYLYEAGQQFASHHPGQADQLNLQALNDRDPYIERLLEGVAFLTAKIQQKIDDDLPEICESLLAQMWPQMLRHVPSCTILKFQHEPGRLQNTYEIPAGTMVASKPVGSEHAPCYFRTTALLKQNPFTISQAALERNKNGDAILRLRFKTDTDMEFQNLDVSEIKLYLHADSAIAVYLYYLLTDKVNIVVVSFPESAQTLVHQLGAQDRIIACHLNAEDNLFPGSNRSFAGFQKILEYFCFREKYCFIALLGLDKITWPDQCCQIDINIYLQFSHHLDFEKFQQAYSNFISVDNFQLHCVPAVNLFKSHCEPIRLTHQRSEYPLIAHISKLESMHIYNIDQVIGKMENSNHQQFYTEMHQHRHWVKGQSYYYVNRRWLGRHYPNYYLSLGGKNDLSVQSISIDATVTNGDYPRRYLGENAIDQESFPLSNLFQIQNIIRPSLPYYPPKSKYSRWLLIGQMALNIAGISELEQLKKMLHCFNWSQKIENNRRIKGIEKLTIRSIHTIHRGALVHGLEFYLQCKEEHYCSIADIYLFGTMLHHLFIQYVSINYFVTTKINCYPSNEVLEWNMIQGLNIPT